MTLVMTTSVSIGAFKTPMNLSLYLQTPIPLSAKHFPFYREEQVSPNTLDMFIAKYTASASPSFILPRRGR